VVGGCVFLKKPHTEEGKTNRPDITHPAMSSRRKRGTKREGSYQARQESSGEQEITIAKCRGKEMQVTYKQRGKRAGGEIPEEAIAQAL